MKTQNAWKGLLALTAAAALPIAFAQEQTQDPNDATVTTHAQAQAADATLQQATSAATADMSAQSRADAANPKTWTDVEGDKDGNISKSEAASEPAVGQIFEMADPNKDSELTPDEHKAYVAKANEASKPSSSGG